MNSPRVRIDLSLDPFVAVGLIIDFLAGHFAKKGFADAVLGVSGGVDSAVGAVLAVEALGASHVKGLAMPAGSSDPASLRDAETVASAFGFELLLRPVGPVVDAFFDGSANVDRMRIGNAAARARMMRLFDYSYEHHALVIGTSNKTELLLGYGTWYGDLACSINPIGDLYKTQIWQLADFLGVPATVIHKAPSADLWPGQTDEGELGFAYEDVDQLLYLMIDGEYSFEALVDHGFSPEFIRKVVGRITSSQFKRSLPTIAKVSAKTVGIDFHLSRDWGT
ncbi:MAG: NAD+ synthase [candidate division Zixibacteria bacterium]|nr:NAD+ synthase [candidate division Zixibacteria bacterium]